MATRGETVELLYDGHCSSCATFARAVRALDSDHRINFTELQDEGARHRLEGQLGAAYWGSFHLVERKGTKVASGPDALPRLAELLPAVRPFAAALFKTPGLRQLPAAAYAVAAFARSCALPHRHG